ncbi:NAD(P)-binding protein [Aulographum hederae CBS 113979]|uniref:NAD(P)-binding protein n=1 Tax=Aulographum hederae CBS 113979 TaxID=1176131 RepID=A0A6G1HCY5_9PEZI|nr:NAD(P)-binding protein [Aulographum hederae CBS 113979]
MPESKKVAIITGGASGMGLAVAHALSALNTYHIHLFDMNASAGASAVSSLGPSTTTFHTVNVASYASLSSAFRSVFAQHHRLDFVFANAGIGEKTSFYRDHETGHDGEEPPPEPQEASLIVDVCLKSVVFTAWLAQHYFRVSQIPDGEEVNRSLVMTASCGGLYPSYYSASYSAAKHGVVGLMRSIAPQFWRSHKVRVNAICPGTVRTGLLTSAEWETFPEEFFTPVEKVVEVVMMLVEGVDREGAPEVGNGWKGDGEMLMGRAVEVSGTRHYYREQVGYCDEGMRAVMASTDVLEMKH